jgi:hypothetical protein
MNTQRLDQIVRRQRSRTTRDVAFALGLALIVSLGLGMLASSARGAALTTPPAATSR